MKKAGKVIFRVLFVISVICNLLLAYFLYDNLRPLPSVMRFGFDTGEGKTVIYCEKSADITAVELNYKECTYKIGDSEIYFKDDIYLVSHGKRINLSETGCDAFVINSDGELLYRMVNPEDESNEKYNIASETVFATPSGKKYHSDIYCAGKSAFETEKETAELFGRTPCSICCGE